MILNYIALGLAGAFFLLSVISAVTEAAASKNSSAGRAFRSLRIRLREVTMLPYLVIVCVLLIIASKANSADWRLMWLVIGVFSLSLIILYWFRIHVLLRSRRHRKKSVRLVPLSVLPENELLTAEIKEASMTNELTLPETDAASE